MANFIKSKATEIANLIAGYGSPFRGRANMTAVTSLNMTPPNYERRPPADTNPHPHHDAKRLKRPAWCSGEPSPIDAFTYDMLRRACSIADGNAFFNDYDPKKVDRRNAGDEDMSIQYSDEAGHAALALDGLNIVPEDLIAAAALGKSFQRFDAANHAPSEAESAEALQRIALRLLCDTDDAAIANIRISAFVNGLEATRKQIFGGD